jgi:hypothetical protein
MAAVICRLLTNPGQAQSDNAQPFHGGCALFNERDRKWRLVANSPPAARLELFAFSQFSAR